MKRLQRMDGLRGLMALYVMAAHAVPLAALPPWAIAPFTHGEAAVDLFFALSGLVIVNALERHDGRFYPFMATRARRLLPAYFCALMAGFLLLPAGNSLTSMSWVGKAGRVIVESRLPPLWPWHFAAHVLLLQGLIPPSLLPYAYITLLGPAWSLSTE